MDAPRPVWLRSLPDADLAGWRWGWTTTAGPDFHSPCDSAAQTDAVDTLVTAIGLRAGAWVQQVHGGAVVRAEQPGCSGEADAMWTSVPGLGVVGRSADCPLVLVAGSDSSGTGLYGFAHASWRSTIAGITANLLAEMVAAGLRPAGAHAVICPSAGPCCYEVGEEVKAAACDGLGRTARQWFPALGGRQAFDLWSANGAQLESAGLSAHHIFRAAVCTICGGDEYHSYRRDGQQAGRFAAVSGGIVLAGSP